MSKALDIEIIHNGHTAQNGLRSVSTVQSLEDCPLGRDLGFLQ